MDPELERSTQLLFLSVSLCVCGWGVSVGIGMVCDPSLPSRFDFEGLESGEDGALEKLKSWSRSIEDLQHPSTLSAPYANSLARSARQSALRYVPLPCCAFWCVAF